MTPASHPGSWINSDPPLAPGPRQRAGQAEGCHGTCCNRGVSRGMCQGQLDTWSGAKSAGPLAVGVETHSPGEAAAPAVSIWCQGIELSLTEVQFSILAQHLSLPPTATVTPKYDFYHFQLQVPFLSIRGKSPLCGYKYMCRDSGKDPRVPLVQPCPDHPFLQIYSQPSVKGHLHSEHS